MKATMIPTVAWILMAEGVAQAATEGGPALGVEPIEMATRIGVAFLLGGFLFFRLPSRLLGARNAVRRDVAQAGALLTVAAAILVITLEDSMARAFGAVALGSVVRFRTAIKDPRDVTLYMGAIALGMGCGSGLLAIAATGSACLGVMVGLLDRFGHLMPGCEAPEKKSGPKAVVLVSPGANGRAVAEEPALHGTR